MRLSATVHTVLAAALVATPAWADFTPTPGPITGTVTSAQTLSSGTGTVASGGKITRSSGNTVAISGNSTTLINNGTIENTGDGRAINNGSNSNLTVTNTGIISAQESDAFRVNANSVVTLHNYGTIRVLNADGGQALDWAAITSQSNTINNYSTGIISANGEDAIRPGQNGVINNAGTISATLLPEAPEEPGDSGLTGSDGIDLRTEKHVTVTNTGLISGRHGIATDGENAGPSSLTLYNNAGTIQALNGSGVNIDGVSTSVTAYIENAAGATIKGGAMASALTSDGDGIDVDGVLTLHNRGDVLGLGAKGDGNNAEGIAAGGGTIVNYAGGRITGSTLGADAPFGDPGKAGNGILIDDSDGGNAIAATTVTNSGLIQGLSGFGIKIVGTFNDVITNEAGGTIQGAGTGATLQTGGGDDTVYNQGAIVSETGKAIDLGDGADQLVVYDNGGLVAPSIVGDVSGGAGYNIASFNTGNFGIAYAGELSNFNQVQIIDTSGHGVTFSGVNTYAGTTGLVAGTLTLDGANRLSSSSVLRLQGGNLALENAGGPNGQTFAGLVLQADGAIDLGQSSLTFGSLDFVADDVTLSLLNFYAATSPDYAIRFTGNYSTNESFLTLLSQTTIDGLAAIFNFDGTYTNVLAAAPVPIPAAWIMLMSGLGALGAASRRRKQAAGNPVAA